MLKCTLSLLVLAAVSASEKSEDSPRLPGLSKVPLQRDEGHINLHHRPYDFKVRDRRQTSFPGLNKPTHRQIVIPGWNPHAKTNPWQVIKIRNKRSVEALSSQESLYRSPRSVEELASQEVKYRSPRSVEFLSSQESVHRSPRSVEEVASQEVVYRSPRALKSVETLSSQEIVLRNARSVEELSSQESVHRSRRSVEALSSQEGDFRNA